MKKHYFIITAIVFTVIGTSVIIAAAFTKPNETNNHTDKSQTISYNDISEIKIDQPIYILQNTNGIIGVYRIGEKTPKTLIDVKIDELPEQDQLLLKDGIMIYSEEELHYIVEDFDS